MALIESLWRHEKNPFIHVLCLDEETKSFFSEHRFKNVFLYEEREIVSYYPKLENAREDRSRVEFIFTLGSSFVNFVFQKLEDNQLFIYLDADVLLFSNITDLLIVKIKDGDCILTPHAFSEKLQGSIQFGKYNVGIMAFKKNINGGRILDWWMSSCMEWCYDRLEDGKFADQKYLERFCEFGKVIEMDVPSVYGAPWNLEELFDRTDKLLCYHFHRFNVKNYFFAYLGFAPYLKSEPTKRMVSLYYDYWKILKKIEKKYQISTQKTLRHAYTFGRNEFMLVYFIKKLIRPKI